MLNISPNSIQNAIEKSRYPCLHDQGLAKATLLFRNWLIGTLVFLIILQFLPWTQNIQSKGKITTLYPQHRPQTIHATIPGRIEKWFVQEGQLVNKGDTIVFLSEVKAEYFDPALLKRTQSQVSAKEVALQSYADKVSSLTDQSASMRLELALKQEQLKNKIRQAELKVESETAMVDQARLDLEISTYRLKRTDTLYAAGIKPLTELEGAKLKEQEAKSKWINAQNKLLESQNALTISKLDLQNVLNEYGAKIAKVDSDRFSALSDRYNAEAELAKLQNQLANYSLRASFYYITAPQNCYITKTLQPGLGETVKEGDPIVGIMPSDYELAAEIFVRPMDLPLISIGQEVRFLFDGWPALVFSGWPDQSFGSYKGTVFAVDNVIGENNLFRVLVKPDNEFKTWPKALRVGSGLQGIALLKHVPLYYEIWRQLNGFPPDYYQHTQEDAPKLKAPIKSVK